MLKETSGLRNRGGLDSLDTGRGKLTPTPRRSIHSFKVSESSRQVMASETRERTEGRGRVVSSESGGSGCVKNLLALLKVFVVLAILAAVLYAVTYKNDEANTIDQIIDAVNTAQDEAPPAANIGDL